MPRRAAIAALFACDVVRTSFGLPPEDLFFCDIVHQPELWRVVVAEAVDKVSTLELISGHVYEVGVFTGNSMLMLQDALNPPMIWGFDSFAGLPDPSTQEMVSEWHAGKYADDPRLRLKSRLGEGRHGWVAGFYNESLAPESDAQVTTLGMQPVRYLDVDCDLYESTKDALDFFFRNKLLVVGSVVGYDDWWVLPCGSGNGHLHPLSVGEGRAHREAAAKWNATFECIAGPCFDYFTAGSDADSANSSECGAWLRDSAWGVLFRLVSIGSQSHLDVDPESISPLQHGFTMGSAAVESFRAHNANCKSIRADGQVYTLRDEAMQLRRADALARNESGVLLKFEWPQVASTSEASSSTREGTKGAFTDETRSSYVPWQAQINGVQVSVDVSGDGVDAEAVRKDPSAFHMCYGVLLHAHLNSESNILNCAASTGGSAKITSEWVALPGEYAPHCSPLVRGGGSLESVAVPPLYLPNQPSNIPGDAVLAAWLEPRQSVSATSSLHDSISPSVWLSDPSVLKVCGERRVGLVTLPIEPPLEEIETDAFGRSEEELPHPLLRVLSPTNGDEWAAEMPISIDVDATIPDAEALRADPTAYEICVSGRPSGERKSGQLVADYCVPLVGGPPELPKVKPILTRRSRQVVTSANGDSAAAAAAVFEAGVEAWLQRRSSNGIGSSPLAVARIVLSTLHVLPADVSIDASSG